MSFEKQNLQSQRFKRGCSVFLSLFSLEPTVRRPTDGRTEQWNLEFDFFYWIYCTLRQKKEKSRKNLFLFVIICHLSLVERVRTSTEAKKKLKNCNHVLVSLVIEQSSYFMKRFSSLIEYTVAFNPKNQQHKRHTTHQPAVVLGSKDRKK